MSVPQTTVIRTLQAFFALALCQLAPLLNCASPSFFQSSRTPVRDFQGLLQVLGRSNVNPVTPLLTPQVIEKYGYVAESHEVHTQDGYILTMHRIPFSKRGSRQRRLPKPVVYLQHGLFASSFEWFMNEEEKLLRKP